MYFEACQLRARPIVTILFTLCGLLLFESAAKAEGTVSGQIRDRATRAPIPFAKIVISGCAELNALKDGAYIVDCPSGTGYQMEVRAKGYYDKLIGPLVIENDSFTVQDILLDRQTTQQAENYQDDSSYENTQPYQTTEDNRTQQTEAQSGKAALLANLISKIATDRLDEHYEKKKSGGERESIDNGFEYADCDALIQSGDVEAIYYNDCGDCAALIDSGDPDLIDAFECQTGSAGTGGTTTSVSCDVLIESGDIDAIYNYDCDDCTDIVASGTPELIKFFACQTGSSGAGGTTTGVSCDVLIRNGDIDAMYDNYCYDCAAIIGSGNLDLIDEFGCEAESTENFSNNPKDSKPSKSNSTTSAIDLQLKNKLKNSRLSQSSSSAQSAMVLKNQSAMVLKNNESNIMANIETTQSPNAMTQDVSIRNKNSIVNIIRGGPEARLKLTGINLDKLTSVLVITPDGIQTRDISARLDKNRSNSERYVYMTGYSKAKLENGYYRLVARTGKISFTLDINTIRINVRPSK